jgi:hypothetical protein
MSSTVTAGKSGWVDFALGMELPPQKGSLDLTGVIARLSSPRWSGTITTNTP